MSEAEAHRSCLMLDHTDYVGPSAFQVKLVIAAG